MISFSDKGSAVFRSALLLTALALGYGLCFGEERQGIVARVNGVPITEVELEKAIDAYIPPGVFHGSPGGERREQYRRQALDFLIERELLHQEAKARGLSVGEDDVEKALSEIKKRFKDKKAFDKALKESGLSLRQYKDILKKNELIESFLKSEVEQKSGYSDREVEEYYNADKGKFLRPEEWKIRHILLKVPPSASEKEKKVIEDKAADILKKARAGADFSELAYEYSEDDYRVKGGDLGWVHKGRLESAIEEAALKLETGEMAMVETTYGFHLVKLEGKKPAEQLSFDEVKDSLKKDLEAKRARELKDALLSSLRGKAKIEIY